MLVTKYDTLAAQNIAFFNEAMSGSKRMEPLSGEEEMDSDDEGEDYVESTVKSKRGRADSGEENDEDDEEEEEEEEADDDDDHDIATKGKGKGKAAAVKGKAKGKQASSNRSPKKVFKSAEFIEDSDDDTPVAANATAGTSKQQQKKQKVASVVPTKKPAAAAATKAKAEKVVKEKKAAPIAKAVKVGEAEKGTEVQEERIKKVKVRSPSFLGPSPGCCGFAEFFILRRHFSQQLGLFGRSRLQLDLKKR